MNQTTQRDLYHVVDHPSNLTDVSINQQISEEVRKSNEVSELEMNTSKLLQNALQSLNPEFKELLPVEIQSIFDHNIGLNEACAMARQSCGVNYPQFQRLCEVVQDSNYSELASAIDKVVAIANNKEPT